jgi:hypothetical protein
VLTLIEDLPPTVVGVEAHDKVTSEDYEQVLIPAVQEAAAASDDQKVSVLYIVGPEFPDYTAGALWQDTKLGVGRFFHWDRIAIVGDVDWLPRAIHALGWALPADVKVFASDKLDEARDWVAS